MVIDRFVGEYAFLSNFSAARVLLDGEAYMTVEHAYQAAKVEKDATYEAYGTNWGYTSRRWREKIRRASSPAKARQLGKDPALPLRKGWDDRRIPLMRYLLRQKFASTFPLADQLLATGVQTLTEGNTWHDQFWGRCYCTTHQWEGENHLGMLLMEIRLALPRGFAGELR